MNVGIGLLCGYHQRFDNLLGNSSLPRARIGHDLLSDSPHPLGVIKHMPLVKDFRTVLNEAAGFVAWEAYSSGHLTKVESELARS